MKNYHRQLRRVFNDREYMCALIDSDYEVCRRRALQTRQCGFNCRIIKLYFAYGVFICYY